MGRGERELPRQNDFIVHAIEFYMLQSPAFVKSLWYNAFLQAAEVRRVVQSYVDSVGVLLDEWEEERGRAVFRGFSCSS